MSESQTRRSFLGQSAACLLGFGLCHKTEGEAVAVTKIHYKWIRTNKIHVRQNADFSFTVTDGPEKVWVRAPYTVKGV
jgi:hypothetical protein